MPEPLVPMSGTTADKFLSKQVYKNNRIAQNMFSSATRKDKKIMLPQTLLKGLTIQKLWDNVFQDNTEFLRKYHDRRNESKLEIGPWDYAVDHGSGSRFVSLVAIVEVPRAGTPTPLNQAHRFAYINTPEGKLMLVYQISSQTPEVPAGGSFRTEAYFEITADSADSDCSIAIWGNCRKMSMSFSAIQYIATPRAIKEMTSAYRQMVNMISEDQDRAMWEGSRAGGRGPAPASTGGWMCEEKALLTAAREAQIQTMRYRWMEQQAEIEHLQRTVSLLKWMAYVQVAAVVVALSGFGYLLKRHLDLTPEA
ncbi:hypothetical protein CGC21_20955 [Leishmania donovani]|uniref:VASt domain-containing protein n=1 Tax=Leishmania donovani TaxID=5661 RepID=A0A504X4D9_LEIDO|nr:hypothetical protein CGC21_20955 [Leishmania donovani]